MLIMDTHALFWWVNQTPGKLAQGQIAAIESADELAISAMTCWEMAWLVKHDRIALKIPIASWLDEVERDGVRVLPVTRPIAVRAVELAEHHKDPADRIIIATSVEHQAKLVSMDERFPLYEELGRCWWRDEWGDGKGRRKVGITGPLITVWNCASPTRP